MNRMGVVTLGESMVLVRPADGSPVVAAGRFVMGVAGAESNVAVALARLGHRVAFMGRVGDDAAGWAEAIDVPVDPGKPWTPSVPVTPTADPEVVTAAVERGVPIVPGAATPTEIQRAVSAGATAVKLFPASLWSTAAFRDLRTVFPEVAFVPTGGVGAEDAPAWLAAGATAVGMGSALTSGEVDVAQILAKLKGIAG